MTQVWQFEWRDGEGELHRGQTEADGYPAALVKARECIERVTPGKGSHLVELYPGRVVRQHEDPAREERVS